MRSSWIETQLADGSPAWKCASCALVLGGEPVTAAPDRCPVCIARSGRMVALVLDQPAGERRSLSLLALDRRLVELVERYRAAKSDYAVEALAHEEISTQGNYSDDGWTDSAELEASAAREQRSAIALADAAVDSIRGSRSSRPSTHSASRPSNVPRRSLPHSS